MNSPFLALGILFRAALDSYSILRYRHAARLPACPGLLDEEPLNAAGVWDVVLADFGRVEVEENRV